MECRGVVSLLSDYIDSRDMWLSDSEIREIERHLVECPKCQSVKHELIEIKSAARELPLHTPSPALWTRIANLVEAELPKSERPTLIDAEATGWWERFKSRRFTLSLPQLAGAGALALVLLIFGVSNMSTPNQTKLDFSGARNALLPDEDQIKAELERRLSGINARKAKWDPQRRAEFDRHLNKIEESLKSSRQKLQANPDDKVQQQMVLTLYSEKRQLLDDVERLKW
jgi:hypothetical protein